MRRLQRASSLLCIAYVFLVMGKGEKSAMWRDHKAAQRDALACMFMLREETAQQKAFKNGHFEIAKKRHIEEIFDYRAQK